jgi:hypothetical protein
MGWARSTHGGHEELYRGLMGKPDGKRQLGRRRRRQEDNIKTYL